MRRLVWGTTMMVSPFWGRSLASLDADLADACDGQTQKGSLPATKGSRKRAWPTKEWSVSSTTGNLAAVIDNNDRRPMALRPRLSTGLPLSWRVSQQTFAGAVF